MPDDKKGKGRPAGAKNKPKSVAELQKELAEAKKREGIADDTEDTEDTEDTTNEDLELDTGDDDEDEYICGDCGYKAKKSFNPCPECGESLSWEG